VELSFTDNGSGMTPDVLSHLFEPFFTTKEVGKGTGLGLSISQRIIRDHDGTLEATSAGTGQGSTFRMRLPTTAPGDSERAAA
jgi:signal transduction histidine kinase